MIEAPSNQSSTYLLPDSFGVEINTYLPFSLSGRGCAKNPVQYLFKREQGVIYTAAVGA
jgi:hypothetical protein